MTGAGRYLQGPRRALRLPAPCLLDELAAELVLQLRVREAHLQGALGQRHVVVDGRRVHSRADEELAGLREEEGTHSAGPVSPGPALVGSLELPCQHSAKWLRGWGAGSDPGHSEELKGLLGAEQRTRLAEGKASACRSLTQRP